MSFQSSIQRDLDRFYKVLSKSDFNIRVVTKGALSQARKKLNAWAFTRLNEVAVKSFYDEADYYTWHGMRVLSIDGTTTPLPYHPGVQEHFPPCSFGRGEGIEKSLGRISVLYDVLNHLAIDARMDPFQTSEKTQLLGQLDKVQRGDMLLLDRGYPSFKLFFLLHAKGIQYCMRLNEKWWLMAKKAVQGDEQDYIINFTLPEKRLKELGDDIDNIQSNIPIRIVKVKLPDGSNEILATSLADQEKYSHQDIADLYRYRWNEEEAFKLLKARMELGAYSGKTLDAVLQDFHSKIFMLTLMAAYAHPIEEKVRQEYKADQNRMHDQKINRTNAIATVRDLLIPLFIRKTYRKAISIFDLLVGATREIVRPNRRNPRKKQPKRPIPPNYKHL